MIRMIKKIRIARSKIIRKFVHKMNSNMLHPPILLITLMKEIIEIMQIPIRPNNMANPLQSITNHLRMEADIVEITTNAHNTKILQTENPINRIRILPMVKIKIQEERTIWGIILMKRNNVHLM